MARQSGVIKIEGTMDDITFVRRGNKYFARKKTSVNKSRIQSDPAFVRTRENGTEFSNIVKAGSLIRSVGAPIIRKAYDPTLCNRLVSLLAKVKNEDLSSVRGLRNVASGLTSAAGKQLFKGYHLNGRAHLNAVLFAPFALTTATGTVVITDMIPQDDLQWPANSTHVTFRAAYVVIDFETALASLSLSNEVNLATGITPTTVTLIPDGIPVGTGTKIYLLLVSFFQEINGMQYSLNNGSFNALTITDLL